MNAVGGELDVCREECRYAARPLKRSPGFAIAAVAIGAIGIGATSAAFTMVDHVLISPLPFARQERLVKLFEDHWANGIRCSNCDVAPANYRDWKRLSTSFEGMEAYRGLSANMAGQGDPHRIEDASATRGMFTLLGAETPLPRHSTPPDTRASTP